MGLDHPQARRLSAGLSALWIYSQTMNMSELSFLVLTSLADEPRHGYAILGDITALTGGRVEPQVATLYRTIDRLVADCQIVEHSSEVVAGRFRRSYRLTDKGIADLRAEAALRAATVKVATARLRRPNVGMAGGAT